MHLMEKGIDEQINKLMREKLSHVQANHFLAAFSLVVSLWNDTLDAILVLSRPIFGNLVILISC